MRATHLDESVFDDLADRSGSNLISVLIPTHKTGREIAQDQIRLKNGLSEIDDQLADLGWKPRPRRERLAVAMDLLDDREFWEHQDAGLALFIDDDGEVETVSTTSSLDGFATVMPVFMLRPLVGDLNALRIPVLALTRDEVGLFVATRFSFEPLPGELPSYDDVNWFVDRETQRQQHPDRAGTTRSRHGHEDASRDDEDLTRFLREVDDALEDFDSGAKLIVLGDDDLAARFANVSSRETTSPPNSGISTPFTNQDVEQRLEGVIEQMEQTRLDEVLSATSDSLGTGMGTSDLEDALAAAMSGRVETLVIHTLADPVWGRFDESSFDAAIHESKQPGDVDLLDRLVVWASRNGAEIVASDSPVEGKEFAAIFRY